MLQHEAHFLDCLTKLQNQLSNINYDDILTAILFLNIEFFFFLSYSEQRSKKLHRYSFSPHYHDCCGSCHYCHLSLHQTKE